MDLFCNRRIIPMLLKQKPEPFDSDDYIFELKIDGIRCLAYLDQKETTLINRRLKNLTDIFPELKDINKQVKEKCILDGEITYIGEDGRPDFNILQMRNLVGNPFKIKLQAQRYPVTYVVYDIIYYKGEDITLYDLIERKKILEENVVENDFINVVRYIENKGIAFFNRIKEENLEGIIAKLKTSTYQIGKRSGDWLKIKNLIDEDFIICGYILDKDLRIRDLVLGKYENGKLVFAEYIYLERKRHEEMQVLKFAESNTLDSPLFKGFSKDVIWITPKLVCTVSYLLRTKQGNMRQPFFKAIRDDKFAEDC